jgi:hypothetical protein
MKMQTLIRLVVAALLGVAMAVLVSCGSSGSGLIPTANAGPLQSDFEAVARAAASGNGSCAATESALGKTEQDFLGLPASVDRGLHARLGQGIANLRKRALAMCTEPSPTATSTTETQTTTTQTTTSTETTPTTTTSTTTTPTSTQTTPTTTTPPSQSGGTEAGEGEAEAGKGKGKGKGEGEGNGVEGAGGASAGGGQ